VSEQNVELHCRGIAAFNARDVDASTCTHHFKVLREAGVLYQPQKGTAHLNTLRRDELEAIFPGLLATILEAASQPIPGR
jgi:hypothetical protein